MMFGGLETPITHPLDLPLNPHPLDPTPVTAKNKREGTVIYY